MSNNDNGQAAAKMRTGIYTFLGTSALGFVAWVVTNKITEGEWRGRVNSVIEQKEMVARDVSTALTVLGDHGTELQLVRTQIEGLRGEMTATRAEMLRAVDISSVDRFRSTDWKRERQILDAEFVDIDRHLSDVQNRLKRMEDAIKEQKK